MKLLKPWLFHHDVKELANGRVVLRTPDMDDFEDWRDLRLASRTFLERWEPKWDERELTRSFFRTRLAQYRALLDGDQNYTYFVFTGSERQLCGGITLSNVRRGVAQTATLGYWIGQRFARQGLMTDAVRALLPHAFGELRLHRIEAACLPSNQASISLLTRCGFHKEGYAKAYLKIADIWQDHVLFARLTE
jgi:[ribosomal protein S5]-alanine N-acetyltransferase